MNIKIQTLSPTGLENNDWHDIFRILVDNTERFFVFDGEPEDNMLARNFNDTQKLKQLFLDIYSAGSSHSGVSIVEEQLSSYP